MIIGQYFMCEKCGKAGLRFRRGLCPECAREERKRNEYENFYRAVRQYAVGKISRERFEFDWEREQKAQGITAARLKRIGGARHEK
jgi:hypothetical protein